MSFKKILLTMAISAATSILLDYVLPLRQMGDGNLKRI